MKYSDELRLEISEITLEQMLNPNEEKWMIDIGRIKKKYDLSNDDLYELLYVEPKMK